VSTFGCLFSPPTHPPAPPLPGRKKKKKKKKKKTTQGRLEIDRAETCYFSTSHAQKTEREKNLKKKVCGENITDTFSRNFWQGLEKPVSGG
jgi:hypothetical protein